MNNRIKAPSGILLVFCVLFVLLYSCSPQYSDEVQSSLNLAKKNKKELVKVLEYYRSRDSLKYEAACFLIVNMRYHRSEKKIILPKLYFNHFKQTDSIYSTLFSQMPIADLKKTPRIDDNIRKSLAVAYFNIPAPTYMEGEEDLETISADFLIDNIDTAFDEWKSSPYLKDMDFNEFKEAILPYRTSTEDLIFRRSELREMFREKFKLDSAVTIYDAIDAFNTYIDKMQRLNINIDLMHETGLFDLFITSKDFKCFYNVSWYCNILRACGIPVVFEFTPQWPDRENRHFWAATPDSSGIYLPYSPPKNNIKEDWQTNLQYAGIVYRKTFAKNETNISFHNKKNETIPFLLDDILLEDQTFRYRSCVDLSIPVSPEIKSNLFYLSYITRSGLVPVKYGRVSPDKRTIEFNQVPIGLLFIVSYYNEHKKLVSVGDPFILQKDELTSECLMPLSSNVYYGIKLRLEGHFLLQGDSVSHSYGIKIFSPSDDSTSEMTVYRKYPLKEHLVKLQDRFNGAYLIATTQMKGKNKYRDTIFTLKEGLTPYLQHIDIKASKKYNYYILSSKDKSILNISHLEYLSLQKTECFATELPVFDNTQLSECPQYYAYSGGEPLDDSDNAFDGNPETFSSTRFTTIKFEKPVKIDAIRIAPRIANNHIVKEKIYCLYYLKNGEWKIVNKAKAKHNYLKFDNVPTNALYLLRNLDDGREELPFLYENNTQRWVK